MNQEAKALGMTETHFQNPAGITSARALFDRT